MKNETNRVQKQLKMCPVISRGNTHTQMKFKIVLAVKKKGGDDDIPGI